MHAARDAKLTEAQARPHSHAELSHGMVLLQLLAEHLPRDDVEYSVVGLLFNRQPFVDFRRCVHN